jgi:hypothetical protein
LGINQIEIIFSKFDYAKKTSKVAVASIKKENA